MANTSFLRRRWKLIINIVTVVALAALVYAIRDQFQETFHNLFKVNMWALLLLIPIQVANYDSQTRLYRHLFAIVGHKMSYKYLSRTALELNFVNHVFPSGGVTGISYFSLRTRDAGATPAQTTAVQLIKLVLLFLSFEIWIVIGMFSLAIQGHMSSLILFMASAITTLLVVGTLGFAFIIGKKSRIAGFFSYATRWLNKLIHVVRPKSPETINVSSVENMFEELHDNYVMLSHDWNRLKLPFFWALMANFWELASIYIVYVAFGEFVNIGAIILAYAVANVAGLVSVLPGGVGVYEGLMTLVLSATGVPSRLSLPVTVMYRVLNTLIQIPPGWYFYHKYVNRKKPTDG